eukprot:TRINITY_DN1607_c0_g1_i1.p1 TRINITY_DN1607_c0_g1~~TRINITY_DN1607_c0_g1_i1.p1  ORF type:complete len:462 (+),score=150.77 TRINITY_DN1607_c0_g1_i1:938-2323(+)
MLWKDDDQPNAKWLKKHIPPPKQKLPIHNESYNPPIEYLLDEKEIAAWKDLDPEDRLMKHLPQKYDALRKVPLYKGGIQERFDRCLDLYLCPRTRKMKQNTTLEALLPQLPKPNQLKPFPTVQTQIYTGHTQRIQAVSVHPLGQWLASGGDDKTVRLWEVATGRCWKVWKFPGKVTTLCWNPNPLLFVISVAVENRVSFIEAAVNEVGKEASRAFLLKPLTQDNDSPVKWEKPDPADFEAGILLQLTQEKDFSKLAWHIKGDYLATVAPNAGKSAVLIHQISKQGTQTPFKNSKGTVETVSFHPTKPLFIVATQISIRIYNLLKQQMVKKLAPGVKWISSLAVHPGGDNLIMGSYDKRLCWFDLDMAEKPYKTMRHHKKAIRSVTFHPTLPLFASCSDDANVTVFHGRVFNDLLSNPLIVPVKILRGHKVVNELGVLDCVFHPTQPWIFSAGADRTIRLFT